MWWILNCELFVYFFFFSVSHFCDFLHFQFNLTEIPHTIHMRRKEGKKKTVCMSTYVRLMKLHDGILPMIACLLNVLITSFAIYCIFSLHTHSLCPLSFQFNTNKQFCSSLFYSFFFKLFIYSSWNW